MKSKLLLVLIACMLLVGMAVPASAAHEPTGEWINLLAGDPDTYPADEPFFIEHGFFGVPSQDVPVGRFGFSLEVDGVDQGKGKLTNISPGLTGEVWVRWWLFNFEDGMPAGDVTFTGYWYAPCQYSVDLGMYPGPCNTPNEQVVFWTAEHTVTFS